MVVQTHPRWSSYASAPAWPTADLVAHGFDTFACNNATNSRDRGYERVVLLGTSAGGPLVAFYPAAAERGNERFPPGRNSGAARYDPGFLRRCERAQAERMNRLIASARERLERLRSTGRPFVDDRAHPAFVDLAPAHESRAPHELQPGDRHERIRSDRIPTATTRPPSSRAPSASTRRRRTRRRRRTSGR